MLLTPALLFIIRRGAGQLFLLRPRIFIAGIESGQRMW